jgi:hypothetical protein
MGGPEHTPGFLEYRRLVESNCEAYQRETNRKTKLDIIIKIFQGIRNLSPPGRFLEKSPDGQWKLASKYTIYTKCQNALQRALGYKALTLTPNVHDVMCDPASFGTGANDHFRHLIESTREAYQKETSYNAKRAIIYQIVQGLQNLSPPGRFLDQAPDGRWQLASVRVVYMKCRRAFEKPTESTTRKRKCNATTAIDQQDGDEESASPKQRERNSTNVIELYDDCGVKRYHLGSMLHVACRLGAAPEVIQVLMEQDKAFLRTPDKAGCLPLHLACKRGQDADLEVVRLLVYAYPSGTTRTNRDGNTPLDEAKKSAADEAVTSYIEKWQGITSTFLPGEIAT